MASRQNADGVYELISDNHKLETANWDAKLCGFQNRLRGTGPKRRETQFPLDSGDSTDAASFFRLDGKISLSRLRINVAH